MTIKPKRELCAAADTQSGNPCRRRVPCPYHNSDGRRKEGKERSKANRDVLRKKKLIQLRLEGKTVKDSGLGAGYSPRTCEAKIYQIMESPEVKSRIQAHIERANLQIEETIGTLVHQMRFDVADFFPGDELLQRAKLQGISHLIKKIKRRPVVAGFDADQKPIFAYELEIEGYSSQEAAKHLTKVFGQEKLRPT